MLPISVQAPAIKIAGLTQALFNPQPCSNAIAVCIAVVSVISDLVHCYQDYKACIASLLLDGKVGHVHVCFLQRFTA